MNETLAHQLKEAGYRTGVAGKYHLMPVEDEVSLEDTDVAKEYAHAAGFDWAGGLYAHNMMHAGKNPWITPGI